MIASLVRKSDGSRFSHHVALLRTPVLYGAGMPGGEILSSATIGEERLHLIPWEKRRLLCNGFYHLREILRKERIQIIHCHDNRANFLGLLVGKYAGIRLVSTLYGWVAASRKLKFLIALDKTVIRFFDRVIASSDSMRELIPGGLSSKVVTIMNSIDLEKADCGKNLADIRRSLGISDQDFIIATIARLSEEKGQQYLLEALPDILQSIPNVTLLIVGTGPMKAALEAIARKMKIEDRVVFTGFHPDLDEIFPVVDLLVQPSLSESLPMSLLEGMARGRPVVATDVGSVRDAVLDGVTGVLIPPGESKAVARAVKELLRDHLKRKAMGEAGKERVEERFSDRLMVQKIEEIYAALVPPDGSTG